MDLMRLSLRLRSGHVVAVALSPALLAEVREIVAGSMRGVSSARACVGLVDEDPDFVGHEYLVRLGEVVECHVWPYRPLVPGGNPAGVRYPGPASPGDLGASSRYADAVAREVAERTAWTGS